MDLAGAIIVAMAGIVANSFGVGWQWVFLTVSIGTLAVVGLRYLLLRILVSARQEELHLSAKAEAGRLLAMHADADEISQLHTRLSGGEIKRG